MKNLGLLLITLTFASLAHADVQQYSAKMEGPQPAQCPQPTLVQIQTAPKSIEAKQVLLQLTKGPALIAEGANHSSTCMSDIVCEGSDDFNISNDAFVTVTHNNNGEYPTTDLPGFKAMQVMLFDGHSNLSASCYYDLIPRP